MVKLSLFSSARLHSVLMFFSVEGHFIQNLTIFQYLHEKK